MKQIEIKRNKKKIMNKNNFQRRQYKRQSDHNNNNNTHKENNMENATASSFHIDLDEDDNSHVIETSTIGSSIPPKGMTKCRCHSYYASPWNGNCDLCNGFCIRAPRQISLPSYLYKGNDSDVGEENDDDIISEYDDDDESDDASFNGGGLLYFHQNHVTTSRRKRRKTGASNTKLQSPEYVLARTCYGEYRKKRLVDKAGLIRDHTPEEMVYFDTALRTLYKSPKLKSSVNLWAFVPIKWYHNRKCDRHMFPTRQLTRSIIKFSQSACSSSTRMGWDEGLMSLEKNSLNRFCYALLMAISAQGMSDKSVVPHINAFIKDGIELDIVSIANCHYVSKLLRRTSKWVKNSSVVANLAQHIIQQFNGIPPTEFTFYTGLNGFAHKTASLLFWGWRHESICLPVDLHVKNYCQIFGWCRTNACRDEIAFQALHWLEPNLFIAFNDALGSIGQYISRGKKKCVDSSKLDILIKVAMQEEYEEVRQLLLCLRN